MFTFGNLNNILVQENSNSTDINISNINTDIDVENYSFMKETYDFVLEHTRSHNNTIKEFYKNILESQDNQQIINESFDGFFEKAKEIIKKFLDFIKKIFAKFIAKLNSLFKSEKYLKKNKSEFPKFTDSDEFEFNGYKFTIDSSPLKCNALSAWLGDDELVSSDITTQGTLTIEFVTNKYDTLMDKLEDWYDEFRGNVMGVDYEVTSSEYDTELFKLFRDDSESKSAITIDYSYVQQAYANFSTYKDSISVVEKLKREIETDYKKLETALERAFSRTKAGDEYIFKFDKSNVTNTYATGDLTKFGAEIPAASSVKISTEISNKINSYMKAKVTQVNTMSSIHSIAFSACIQAIKDEFNQNKAILYKALAKIKSHKAS